MFNTKQFIVIGLVVILMGILLSMSIKGLVKPKDQRGINSTGTTTQTSTPVLTLDEVSAIAKETLNANLVQQIADLENNLKTASQSEKLGIQKQLAQKWDDVNAPIPAAFYYELIAEAEQNYQNWLKAGDRFTEAYKNAQDSLTQPALIEKAINAYQKALDLEANSLDAKIGLGVAYVNGTSNPMQGIQLLLAVVKENPNNVKANMSLGLFSMKSGQYEKAISRFKTVISQNQDPEAWFYLASSHENLGNKEEAIIAYLKSKELAADPSLGKFVDKKVKELKR
ncbi:MAG: tetratricopeptide repeat protein [Daejeonella sp.]